MEPLPERAPEPEQWAKVSKGSGVAKSVAKSVAPARTSPAAPAGSNAAFDVLRKFANPADDGHDDDEGEAATEESLASKLDSYTVSAPFYHTFEDTGASTWCCTVTSASGYASAPVPISAAVPRARKIGPKAAPPKLEREEELQVILDFKRRQKEERKREKADKPKKKKKKKEKGADAEGNVETEADAEATEASEATVTVDSSAAKSSAAADASALSGAILGNLFASSRYEPPEMTPPEPAPSAEDEQSRLARLRLRQQQQEIWERQRLMQQQQQQQQQRPRVPPPPGLGGLVAPPRAPTAEELLVAQQARELEEQRARMAAMEAQMSQMQAQMEAQMRAQAEAQRQAEAAAAAKAAAKAEAAAAAAAAKAREDAMRRDWRAAPVANGAGEGGDAVVTGGTIARNPYGGKRGGRASTPPPGFVGPPPGFGDAPAQAAPAAERPPPTFGADSYVPPAFRR